jgi:hypothetical protein
VENIGSHESQLLAEFEVLTMHCPVLPSSTTNHKFDFELWENHV